jgi:hypothetical protein
MVQVLIFCLTINLGLLYLANLSWQENKLAQMWVQQVRLQASLQHAQDCWLRELDDWLQLPPVAPQACKTTPCLLEPQPVQAYLEQPLAFWQKTPLAYVYEDVRYMHKTYAIVEVVSGEDTSNLLRGTFVAINESGMQLRSQLIARQNFGQISWRTVLR